MPPTVTVTIVPALFSMTPLLHSAFALPLGTAPTFALTLLLVPAVVAISVSVDGTVATRSSVSPVTAITGAGAPGKCKDGDYE